MRILPAILSIMLASGCAPPAPEASGATLAEAQASPQAAAAVVRDYYRLVEAGRLAEAVELREDGLQEDVAPFLSLQADVASARSLTGEGGFAYVRIPVALTGRFVTWGDYRAAGGVILRRSGDGDARARRWRIYRVEVRAQAGTSG